MHHFHRYVQNIEARRCSIKISQKSQENTYACGLNPLRTTFLRKTSGQVAASVNHQPGRLFASAEILLPKHLLLFPNHKLSLYHFL